MDRIAGLDHEGLASDFCLDASVLDHDDDLSIELPRVRTRPARTPSRLEPHTPDIESIARNHPDEMLHSRILIHLEMLSIVSTKDGDLSFSVTVRKQFARTTVETVRDLQQNRNRRNRLKILDFVNRARRNTRSVAKLLQSEVGLISPTTNSGGNSFEILVQMGSLIYAGVKNTTRQTPGRIRVDNSSCF